MSWQNVQNGQITNRKDHSHAPDRSVAVMQDPTFNMKENYLVLDLLSLDLMSLDVLCFDVLSGTGPKHPPGVRAS